MVIYYTCFNHIKRHVKEIISIHLWRVQVSNLFFAVPYLFMDIQYPVDASPVIYHFIDSDYTQNCKQMTALLDVIQ